MHVFNTHLTPSDWEPAATAPYVLLRGLECRKQQVQELFDFVNETIAQTYDKESDIILCNGDYNIPYTKMPDSFRNMLVKSNPDFEKACDLLDDEYSHVLNKILMNKFDQKSK